MTLEQKRASLIQSGLYGEEALRYDSQNGRYGPIEGVKVGDIYENRKACYKAGVHTTLVSGIVGSIDRGGAYSIVLSGAYEDDIDEGETISYTGTGGRESDAFGGGVSPQSKHQSFDHPDNRVLQKSRETQRPVRVIRGANPQSRYAPSSGFRYDGLYQVEAAYEDKGKSGFTVCKFLLRRLPGQDPLPTR